MATDIKPLAAGVHTVSLSDASGLEPILVGTKALRLGTVLALNYQVPAGFCITTLAFEEFLNHNRLRPAIQGLLEYAESGEPSQLEELSFRIADLITGSEFPQEVAASIKRAYDELVALSPSEPTAVAVRSSGVAEDLPDVSFAGQYESILFVSGLANILAAVKQCWASLWTVRAISYRHARQVEEDGASMALIVQLAIDSTVSGIAFTIDPVTGKEDVVVNSTWGLGSKVASGEYNVDTFAVRRSDRQIVERNVVDKRFMVKPSHAEIGTVEVPVPADLRREASLDAMQLDALVRVVLALEQHFGTPQDVEWAYSGGSLWILQTRPITTAPRPFPIEWEREDDRTVVWTRGVGITERLVDPVTPMSFSLFQRMVKTGWDAAMRRLPLPMLEGEAKLRLFNHYLYWNVNTTAKPKPAKIVPFLAKLLFTLAKGVDLWDKRLPRYLSAVQVLGEFDLRVANLSQLREHLEAVCDLFAESFVWEVYLGTTIELFGDIFLNLVPRLADCTAADAAILIRGLSNITLDMERRLWQLTESLRESPVLCEVFKQDVSEHTIEWLQRLDEGREWLLHFQAFLGDYGHHSPKDDWFFPDWSQDSLLVLRLLQKKLHLPAQDFDAALKLRVREQGEMAGVIRNRLRRRPIRKALFNLLLSMAHRWVPLKEDRQFYTKRTCHQLRLTLHEIGKRLSPEVLMKEDDVFFLSLKELYDTVDQLAGGEQIDLRELTRTRRQDWLASFRLSPPPRIRGDLARDPVAEHYGSRRILRGISASPGVATGVARVIHTPAEFERFLSGEILVTQATNPCWTPVLEHAKAVVTNYGGSLCHCAVLAREMGIPAVVGTAFATGIIRTGSIITVDGEKGIVLVE